jgi:hypothetical protein
MRASMWSEEERKALPSPCCCSGQLVFLWFCIMLRSDLYSLSGQSPLQSKPTTPSRFPRTALSIDSANSPIPASPPNPEATLPRIEIPSLACSASSRADPRSPSIVRSVSFSLGCSLRIVRIAVDVAFLNSNKGRTHPVWGLVRDCQMRYKQISRTNGLVLGGLKRLRVVPF